MKTREENNVITQVREEWPLLARVGRKAMERNERFEFYFRGSKGRAHEWIGLGVGRLVNGGKEY